MIRYLTLSEVFEIHRQVLELAGGSDGIRYLGGLESAIAQPQMTFSGESLYPTLADKAAALGFSLIQNHPFVDGNKRVGHAAMATFLLLNGHGFVGNVDEHEATILAVASGSLSREELAKWIQSHIT